MLNNLLQVSLKEFKRGTKIFQRKRLKLGPVLLSYENGFLSIESGEATAVMNGTGEWHGRAIFSPNILQALAMVPPLQDPVQISYDGGHLFVGSMKIICQWNTVSQAFIEDLANPSLIDLLALKETVPRSEIGGTGLGKKIRSAHEKAERRIMNAAKQLQDLEITETEIRQLLEERIKSRLETTPKPASVEEKMSAFYDYLNERIKMQECKLDEIGLHSHYRPILKTEIAELYVVRGEFKRLLLS